MNRQRASEEDRQLRERVRDRERRQNCSEERREAEIEKARINRQRQRE